MDNIINQTIEKEKVDKKVIYLLGFFLLIILFSIFFLLKFNSQKRRVSLIGKIKGVGFIRIEKPELITPSTPFKIKFIANSDKKDVNAVSLSANFDPNKLTIVNLDTSQSFCQFYPENKFNNSDGSISIQCGAPNPGFNGESTIAIVTFIAKNIGETYINVNENSQILLNDGKGTDIFIEPFKELITILNTI